MPAESEVSLPEIEKSSEVPESTYEIKDGRLSAPLGPSDTVTESIVMLNASSEHPVLPSSKVKYATDCVTEESFKW